MTESTDTTPGGAPAGGGALLACRDLRGGGGHRAGLRRPRLPVLAPPVVPPPRPARAGQPHPPRNRSPGR